MKANERLIKKFLNNQTHITIEDYTCIMLTFDYEQRKSSGSHRIYHKKGATSITIPVPKNTKYIKIAYVKLIIKYLQLEEG